MFRYFFASLIALALLAGAPAFTSGGSAFVNTAHAGDGIPLLDRNGAPFRVQRMTGFQTTFPATYANMDFEFESDYVQICIHPASSTVYGRFGTAVTADSAGNPGIEGNISTFVTDDTTFQTGIDQVTGTTYIGGRAFVLQNRENLEAGTLGMHCQTHPWSTRGLVLNSATTGTATVDVNAFTSR